MAFHSTRRTRVIMASLLAALMASGAAVLAQGSAQAQQTPAQFGGSYSSLDARRQKLLDDWVARVTQVTGVKAAPATFYDTRIRLSSKTTFDAITNALETTPLTDESGQRFGDALDLVERVDMVRGQVSGVSGDHQFRMYAQLKEDAVGMLERSREFKRGADNSVYHRGYPINYRQQGGSPSIQVSIALDRRRADIDVDYRASIFPVSMFNGHLTSANSDVRAGGNYDRHSNRWAGFQNWWGSFFGIRVPGASGGNRDTSPQIFPEKPRIGDKTIDLMMEDFLKAWLVDRDIPQAMAYVSERAFACLMEDGDDPKTFDRGTAPFLLFTNLKAASEAIGPPRPLETLTVGVRLNIRGLKLVTQSHHAQFVIYAVPDDIAARFDCESRLSLASQSRTARGYGNYFGSTFYINVPGGQDYTLALLWAREGAFWKIVSWQAEPEGDELPSTERTPEVRIASVGADASLVQATRTFLDSWLIRKNYDEAFGYLSPRSYACYNLVRNPEEPAASNPAEAAQKVRAAIERAGSEVGKPRNLEELTEGVPPTHPQVRVMNHQYSRTFALSSVPDALADAADCSARTRGEPITSDLPPVYGKTFGMNLRFRTKSGETPVLRTLWTKEADAWRIVVYDVEVP